MARDPGCEGRRLRSALLALPLAVLASACSREQPAVMTTEPNTPPVNYKAEIIAYLRTYLNDPTGVRGAFIAEPQLRNVPVVRRPSATWCACDSTPRDSTGKYEGSRDRLVAFLTGRLDTLVPARKEQCDGANWQPFPELEKLKR